MITEIIGGSYNIPTSTSGYYVLNEAGIRAIAEAMNAKVHIGSGSGKFSINGYSVNIAGTPFVEIGDFYFTILQRSSNSYKYLWLYDKDYSSLFSLSYIANNASNIIAGYSADNIRFIGTNSLSSSYYIFCEIEDIDGYTESCVLYRSSAASNITVYFPFGYYETASIPTCFSDTKVNFVCLQELAFSPFLARFKGIYTSVRQYDCNIKTVLFNGETYDVLGSNGTDYPTFYCKRS